MAHFLDAVVDRYDNRCRDTVFTSGNPTDCPWFPLIAEITLGFHTSAAEILEVYQTAAHFECTSGGMVLVFTQTVVPTRFREAATGTAGLAAWTGR
jgi:hypothetical protein